MNIALIGSGGREHALCKKLRESKKINTIYCLPGNAGTSKHAQNLKIDINNHRNLLKVINFLNIKVVIVGPEEPLVSGIVDFLTKNKIKVFGPSKYASQLEGSKSFMKLICKKYQIPTADFKICRKISEVKKFIKNNNTPIVVKADGLAAGKGVTICKTKDNVLRVANEIFKGKFKSSKKLVLEEYLDGEELSYFVVVDQYSYSFIGSAQDHKKVGEKETGPNTGGMGAYSPAPILNKDLENKIKTRIIVPTLKALKDRKKNYNGFLYIGLMIKNNNPYLIEFNIRMGDPECQVILPRLKTDLFEIILASINNNLRRIRIKWKNLKCMTIVLCAKGYPSKYKKNIDLKVLKKIKLDKNSFIFHAGTQILKGNIFSTGGRILNITTVGKNFSSIKDRILMNIKKLNLKNSFFRKDIGWRVIK